MLQSYYIEVQYRTATNCASKRVTVEADNFEHAIERANAKIRRGRRVVRIDGGIMIGTPQPVRKELGQ